VEIALSGGASAGAAVEVAEHGAHVLLGHGRAGRLAAQRRQHVVGEVAHAHRQRCGLRGDRVGLGFAYPVYPTPLKPSHHLGQHAVGA